MCEAEELIQRTVFELDMQKTAGIWNPAKIQRILTAAHEGCQQKEAA